MSDHTRTLRPSSEQLQDLHVYVIPPELWRQHLRSAANEVITDSISLGFLRIPAQALLSDLRHEIPVQLGDDYLPKDYAFLKSVGRCLTQVKSRQERELKVKHFLPPFAYAPELFILDSSAEPLRDSPSTIFNQPLSGISESKQDSARGPPNKNNGAYGHHNNPYGYPGVSGSNANLISPQYGGEGYGVTPRSISQQNPHGPGQTDQYHGHTGSSPQHKRSTGYPSQEHPYSHDITALTNAHRNNVDFKNGGTTYRKSTNESSGYKSMTSPQGEDGIPPYPSNVQNGNNHNNRYSEQGDFRQSYNQDGNGSPRKLERSDTAVVDDPKIYKTPGNTPKEKYHKVNRTEGDNSNPNDTNPDNSEPGQHYNNGHDREQGYYGGRNEWNNQQQKNNNNNHQYDGERDTMSATPIPGSHPGDPRHQQRNGGPVVGRQNDTANGSHSPDGRHRSNGEHSTDGGGRYNGYEDQNDQQSRQLGEGHPGQPTSRGDMNYKINGPPSERKKVLMKELEEARQERLHAEKRREELVRKARAMQAKTNNRRNQARETWKKKYYEEKKSTPGLEAECQKIRAELDGVHKKYINLLDSSKSNPKSKDNAQVESAKLQFEVDELQRKADAAKMKLTAEMKLRNQAETELRALRAELMQKKMNMNLTRAQRMNAMSNSLGQQSSNSPSLNKPQGSIPVN